MKFALLGHPVSHSLSPVIHAAAYRELGVQHEYGLIDVPTAEALDPIARELRQGTLAGVNITIPWKREAFALADERSALASRLGVANVLAVRDGRLIAHNTDALALETDFAARASGRSALVLGSGGAAPAVVAAAFSAGMQDVRVTARRFTRGAPEAEWPGAAELTRLGARLVPWPVDDPAALANWEPFWADLGLVVQCTSAGMQGKDSGEPLARLVPWQLLPRDALAYDLIYAPLETPFLRVAREAGRRTAHGLDMLVGQAAHAIEIWLGTRPPSAPLLAAALDELARRGRA